MDFDCVQFGTIEGIINDMAATMTPYIATCSGLEPPEFQEFEWEDRKAMLSACTRLVAVLQMDIACYPLTTTAVIFFDVDGNPLP